MPISPQPRYLYTAAFIASCVPNNALTTGRQSVRITIMNLETLLYTETPFVSLGGVIIDTRNVSVEARPSAFVITITTPPVHESLEGYVPVTVTLSQSEAHSMTLTSASVFKFVSPPKPTIVFSSISVDGRLPADSPWAATTVSSKVSFIIRHLFVVPSSALAVYFGEDFVGNDTVYESSGSLIDVRLAVTRVEVTTPIGVAEGRVPLQVRINGTTVAETAAIFTFTDLSKPAIVAVRCICL